MPDYLLHLSVPVASLRFPRFRCSLCFLWKLLTWPVSDRHPEVPVPHLPYKFQTPLQIPWHYRIPHTTSHCLLLSKYKEARPAKSFRPSGPFLPSAVLPGQQSLLPPVLLSASADPSQPVLLLQLFFQLSDWSDSAPLFLISLMKKCWVRSVWSV